MATGCVEPADIVFILDASGSVGASNFQKMLGFVNTLVDGFPIGPTQTHIGLLTFDTKVYNQFHLNKYNDKTAIKNAVTSTQYVLLIHLY
ncbi:MATN2-like protein [Mya arenaria]|nr:MATN2-like protein [Mya arenaria]